MRILLATITLVPLAAAAHPGHPANTPGLSHWVAGHPLELALAASMLWLTAAVIRGRRRAGASRP